MKRVFLDQLHWIALAQTAVGRRSDPHLVEALDLVRYAAINGLASFPLSDTQYFETMKRGDPRSRQELGRVMFEISQAHTISGIGDLLRAEATTALAAWHGLPSPMPPHPFGKGFRHAFGKATDKLFQDPDLEQRAIAGFGQEQVDNWFEEAMIAGPPERLPSGETQRPNNHWGQKQLDGEIAMSARISEQGHTPQIARDIVMYEEAAHALSEVNLVAEERHWPYWQPTSRADVETLVLGMGSKGVLTRMRMSAHENAHFKWEVGDLGDLTSLAVGAAYCDIVVTEKKWGSILKRHQPDLSATVITNLAELPAILVSH